MTAFLRYELHCDGPNCSAVFDSGDARATDTRRHAERSGWAFVVVPREHGGPAKTNDMCPKHASTARGMVEEHAG